MIVCLLARRVQVAFRISSMTFLAGSSFDARGGSFFRGSGHADGSALPSVRRPTRTSSRSQGLDFTGT